MQFEVIVEWKKEVLDPQGRAVTDTLHRLGHKGINAVQVSKRFVVDVGAEEANPLQTVETVARDFLANSVSETFQIRRL